MGMGKNRICTLWCVLAAMLVTEVAIGQTRPSADASAARAGDSAKTENLGYPADWSSHHLVMTGDSAETAVAAGSHDPRYVYNLVQRRAALRKRRLTSSSPGKPLHIDWAVSLENGFVPQDQYPAKYQFGIGSENCNTDYLLLGLEVTTGTQANLVGINNLYTSASPKCNGGSPWVSFAYNTVTHTGGQILGSPTISENGKLVAFVESTSTGSYLHVLLLPNPIPVPPSQTGTVLSPQTPSSCTTPTTVNCMTTLQFSTTSDSNSSPWIDYVSDTAYVGDDAGKLYKITPVFGGGAPALVSDANWPVTVITSGTTKVLTDPILDVVTGRIFMGDSNGYLYAISLTSPAHAAAVTVAVGWTDKGAGTALVDGPIVVNDASNPATNQVFAFTGCSDVVGIGGAISQLPANFGTGTQCVATAVNCTSVDLGSSDGQGNCTTKNVHTPIFDNTFWLNGTATGHMIACGFVNDGGAPADPQMYFFPFASGQITATGDSTFVIGTTKGDECSPLTEFYDGTTDRLFFGVGNTDGYIESSVLTTSASTPNCTAPPTSSCVKAPTALGGTSGIVVDNMVSNGGTNIYFSTLAAGSVNGQKCNVTGGAANPYCAVKLTQSGLQ